MASKGGVIVVVSGEDKTGEVFNAVKKHLDETRDKAKETSTSLGSIGEVLQKGLAAAGIAVGLREVVGRMKEMVTQTMEAGVQLGHLSQQTGISIQNLSVLKYAAQSAGVDFETLTRGFKKLAVTTYEADNGNKTAAKGFNQVGISVEQLRAKGDDMYGVLTLIADKFHALPDGIAKSDAAAKIFGARMGSEMIPILDALGGKLDSVKAEAQALGIVWDEAGIKKMEDMHHSAVMLQGALQGLGLELTSDLAPALENVTTGLVAAIQKMKEWLGLNGKSPAAQAHEAAEMGRTIPDEIYEASNPGAISQAAAAQKAAIDKQLANANLSRAQKAALTKKWNEADLRENQAYFAQLSDQITSAQVDLNNAKKATDSQGLWGVPGPSMDWVDHAQGQLNDLLAQQRTAMDRVNSAQKSNAGSPPPAPPPGGGSGSTDRTVAAQRALDDSLRQLADAGAKLDETRARVHAQTMLSILDEMHKQGMVSEADYLTQKATYQNAAFDAERTKLQSERSALADQMNTLASRDAKTGKDRIETETKLNALRARELEIEGRLVELDGKRATFARQMEDAYAAEMAKPIDTSGMDQGTMPTGIFGSQHPDVKLARWTTDDTKEAKGEAEKFAHGVFDPLFNMSERWDQKWKQMRSNLLNDLGQAAEGQLFGALFGDSSGSGGKGLDGSKGTPKGHGGLLSDGLGLLGGLFQHKGAGTTSNGGLGSGAGTIASAAASAMQMGGGAAAGGSGGIQVVLNNQGSPMQVSQTQQSGGDGGEQQVIQIMLKQLETNGPVAQGIAGLMMLA